MERETLEQIFDKAFERHELKKLIKEELFKAINEDRWITIHPHGEDSEDYRRLKIQEGESVEDAMHRNGWYSKRQAKDEKALKDERKQLYQDILKAKKEGNKELHHKLLERYKKVDALLKGQKQPEKENKKENLNKQQKDNKEEKVEYFQKLNLENLGYEDLRKEQEKLKSFLLENGSFEGRRTLTKILDDIEKNITKKAPKSKIAGVSKGQPMSREKANNNSANPNYHKKDGCSNNCQTCVVAFEARLRGFNVQALGNHNNPTIKDLSHRTNIAWINPETGEHPKYIQDPAVKNAKSCYSWLDKTIEKGNRYTIEFGWKGRGHVGHIVSIDRDENNNLRIYDPQNGKTITNKVELNEYFKRFKYQMSTYGLKFPDPPKVLRIDNLDFNLEVVDKILEKA